MASPKTYTSKYTDKNITDAQYLVEFICERIAARDNIPIGWKFWNEPEWEKIFIRQLTAANKIIKEVNCVYVMQFLRSNKGKSIYSLGLGAIIKEAKKLIPIKFVKTDINMADDDEYTIRINEWADVNSKEVTNQIKKKCLWNELNLSGSG